MVARHERHALGDGMGDDDMVAWVVVAGCFIQAQVAVGVAHVAADGQELDVKLFLHGSKHIGRGLEVTVEQLLVVEVYHQFAHRLATGEEHVLRVTEHVKRSLAQVVNVDEQVDDDAGIKHQPHTE